MKTCIMCIARDEDKFIDEWINYHLSIGFDHIFIMDNNDIDNKLVINNENVTVIPYNYADFSKSFLLKQLTGYNYCLDIIKNQKYDYVATIDVDEFITPKLYVNIKDFIKYEMINRGDNIAELIWETYDDNDIIYERDCKDSVIETYTRKQTKLPEYDWHNNEASWSKSICKVYDGLHFSMDDLGSMCHWPAKKCFNDGFYKTNHIDPTVAIIRHYRTKCLETFINHKLKKQNILYTLYGQNPYNAYFNINKETSEKIEYFNEKMKDIL